MSTYSIAIIGAGNMGAAFAKRVAAAGHQIVITDTELVARGIGGGGHGSGANALPRAAGMLNIYFGYMAGRGASVAPAWASVE